MKNNETMKTMKNSSRKPTTFCHTNQLILKNQVSHLIFSKQLINYMDKSLSVKNNTCLSKISELRHPQGDLSPNDWSLDHTLKVNVLGLFHMKSWAESQN